jgi:hypothetical protein
MSSHLNGSNGTAELSILERILVDIDIVIAIVGTITNLCCIIVFTMINRAFKTNGQMFKYFLMKSICDFVYFIIFSIEKYHDLCSDDIRQSLVLQIIYVYLFHFLSRIFGLYSIYFDILGTIDCYLSIKNKYKQFLTKKVFYLSSSFIVVFFFVFYCGKLFVYRITPIGDHQYQHEKTSLYKSAFYRTLSLAYIIFRDILGSLLSILFNILIFLNIKKISENKKHLKNNEALIKSIEAQENKVKMIYISTLNQVLFHLPNVIHNIYGKYIGSKFWTNFAYFSNTIYSLSYVTPFFIYFLFNNKFHDYFLKLIRIKQNSRDVYSPAAARPALS